MSHCSHYRHRRGSRPSVECIWVAPCRLDQEKQLREPPYRGILGQVDPFWISVSASYQNKRTPSRKELKGARGRIIEKRWDRDYVREMENDIVECTGKLVVHNALIYL